MKRRNFIGISSLFSIGTLIPVTSCLAPESDFSMLLARPLMLSSFLDEEGISLIGKEYLRLNADENNLVALEEVLINSIDNIKDENNVYGKIDQKIAKDFLNHDFLVVNGWVISRTEARQCALFTLI